jgi:hypothetical protein
MAILYLCQFLPRLDFIWIIAYIEVALKIVVFLNKYCYFHTIYKIGLLDKGCDLHKMLH